MRQLSIVHVLPHCGIGGADRVALDLLRYGDPAALVQHLIVTDAGDNRWLPEAREFAESVWALADIVAPRHRAALLVDLIEELRCDVVHIMNSRLAFDALPFITDLPERPATIVHMHGEAADGNGYPRYVSTFYRDHVDAWCPSSRALQRRLVHYGVPPERVHVIIAGIDTQRFTPPPDPRAHPGRPRVLMPARLAEEKNPLLLIEAAAELRQRGHDLEIRLLDGPLLDQVRARARELCLSDSVTLLGSPPSLAEEYASADIAVLTSETEGIPLALIEAMAAGLPVAATAVGGVPELVDQAVGVLVQEHSSSAVADALEPLLSDPVLRVRLGEEGRKRAVRSFDVRDGVRAFEALYQAVSRR